MSLILFLTLRTLLKALKVPQDHTNYRPLLNPIPQMSRKWRISTIIPLYKNKGDITNRDNYRVRSYLATP